MAENENKQGNLEKAEKLYQEALVLFNQLKNRKSQAYIYFKLSGLKKKSKSLGDTYAQKGTKILTQIGLTQ